jgi:integrase
MRVKLKGINHVRKWLKKEGRFEDYYYARKGEGAPRLEGKPGSLEYVASYHAAIASQATTATAGFKTETVGWLIEEKFLKSQYYKKLDPKTQADYCRVIPSIENRFGDLPLEALKARRTRAIVIEWRDTIADGTCETLVSRPPDRSRLPSDTRADIHVQKFAAILSRTKKDGWIDVNPLTEIEPLHHGSRLDKVWSFEDEATFLAEGRPDLVDAYIAAVWTGFREGDCVDLRVSEYDGQFIRRELQKRSRPGKPRKRVMILVVGPFKPILDAMVERTGVKNADLETRANTKILRNSQGQPWADGSSFYTAFKRECERLGIEDRTFHDLRRTAVVRLAIAGCTEPEIVSITGHSSKEVSAILYKHYLHLDPQIAINAMRKLENSTLHFYAEFVRQFVERRLNESKSSTERPTKRTTAPERSASVRSKN